MNRQDLQAALHGLERQIAVLLMEYRGLVDKVAHLEAQKERLTDQLLQARQRNLELDTPRPIGSYALGGKTKAEMLAWIDEHIRYIDTCIGYVNTNVNTRANG